MDTPRRIREGNIALSMIYGSVLFVETYIRIRGDLLFRLGYSSGSGRRLFKEVFLAENFIFIIVVRWKFFTY